VPATCHRDTAYAHSTCAPQSVCSPLPCASCRIVTAQPSAWTLRNACSSGGQRWRPQVISTGRSEPFEDVQLGPLLGKGSYGRVYRAMWNSILVAVKVLS
jgi:hypothetical protein